MSSDQIGHDLIRDVICVECSQNRGLCRLWVDCMQRTKYSIYTPLFWVLRRLGPTKCASSANTAAAAAAAATCLHSSSTT